MESIPDEILEYIFKFTTYKDWWNNIPLVSKRWYSVAKNSLILSTKFYFDAKLDGYEEKKLEPIVINTNFLSTNNHSVCGIEIYKDGFVVANINGIIINLDFGNNKFTIFKANGSIDLLRLGPILPSGEKSLIISGFFSTIDKSNGHDLNETAIALEKSEWLIRLVSFSGQILKTFKCPNNDFCNSHSNIINDTVISMDNSKLFSCSDDSTIKCWSLDIQKNSKDSYIYTIGKEDNYDNNIGHTNGVYSIKILNCNTLCSYSYDNTIRIWSITNGLSLKVFYIGPNYFVNTSMLPNSRVYYHILLKKDNTLQVIKLNSKMLFEINFGKEVFTSYVDSKCNFYFGVDNGIIICSKEGKIIHSLIENEDINVNSIKLSHDKKFIYAGFTNGVVKIY